MLRKSVIKSLIMFSTVCLMASCQTVKPYQKVYLNDEDMELKIQETAMFEIYFQTYREAASGANGGKVGGGCGCN